MTVSGPLEPLPEGTAAKAPPRLGRYQQVLADALDRNLAIGVRAAVANHRPDQLGGHVGQFSCWFAGTRG